MQNSSNNSRPTALSLDHALPGKYIYTKITQLWDSRSLGMASNEWNYLCFNQVQPDGSLYCPVTVVYISYIKELPDYIYVGITNGSLLIPLYVARHITNCMKQAATSLLCCPFLYGRCYLDSLNSPGCTVTSPSPRSFCKEAAQDPMGSVRFPAGTVRQLH